jgi:D-alanine-D-alanine ligase-like ATP-grasp enzyme
MDPEIVKQAQEEQRIEMMWQAFRQGNDNVNMEEFIRMVSREFACDLQEAQQKTSHLLLTE